MATQYPNNLDNFSDPTGSDHLNSAVVPHATQHANINGAIEAIEGTLGINPQGGFASVKARLEDIENDVAAIGTGLVASITDNTVAGAKLVNSSVVEAKIANDAISADKIKSEAVTTSKIKDGNVTTAKLAADTVTYDKVAASTRVTLTRVASQSYSATSGAYVSWTAKELDESGFVSAVPNTTMTTPVGKSGLYLIVAHISGYNNHANDYLQIEVSTGSLSLRSGVSGTASTCTALADLAEGGTVKVYAYNGSGSTANLSGRVTIVKLFDS